MNLTDSALGFSFPLITAMSALLLSGCDAKDNSVSATASDSSTSNDTSDDTSDGDPSGTSGGDPSEGLCEQTPTVIGIDDTNVTSVTAQAVLDDVLGVYDGSMQWVQEGPAIYNGDVGPTTTEFELTYNGGEIRSVEGVLVTACMHDGPCPCPSVLEIDAQLRISSTDGVFDDTFAITIEHSDGDLTGFDPAGTRVSVAFDPDDTAGTFSAASLAISTEFTLTELTFTLDLAGGGALAGAIIAQVEGMGVIGVGTIAQLGGVQAPEACLELEGGSACTLAGCTEVSGTPIFGTAPDMCDCSSPRTYCFPEPLSGEDTPTLYTYPSDDGFEVYDEVVEFDVSAELGGPWRACSDAPEVALCDCEGTCG